MKKKILRSVHAHKQLLIYLAEYSNQNDNFEVDNAITQQGIGEALGIRVEHVSRAAKRLITDGYLSVKTIYIKGLKRKKKAYFLTETGIKQTKEISYWLDEQLILVRLLDDQLIELKFSQINKILKNNLKPFQILKYITRSKEGFIELKQVISDIRRISPKFKVKLDLIDNSPRSDLVHIFLEINQLLKIFTVEPRS